MEEAQTAAHACVVVPTASPAAAWLREAEVPARASDAAGARRLLERNQLAILVVDGRLETGEPLQALLLEAQQRRVPSVLIVPRARDVILLDAEGQARDFVAEAGCPAELLVRLSRLAWRRNSPGSGPLAVGPLSIDSQNFRVLLDGIPVTLTLKEFELLRYMVDNQQRVVRREELLRQVWGYDYYGGARTVDVHVRRLRAKLEDGERRFIETVRQIGYVFRWNGV